MKLEEKKALVVNIIKLYIMIHLIPSGLMYI